MSEEFIYGVLIGIVITLLVVVIVGGFIEEVIDNAWKS